MFALHTAGLSTVIVTAWWIRDNESIRASRAAAIRADGELDRWLRDRYASRSTGIPTETEAGKHDSKSLEKHMLAKGDITLNKSGRQEAFENLVNRFVL